MRKVLILSLAAAALTFSCNSFEGLSNKDTQQACRLEVSSALDSGDYDQAIALIEGKCSDKLGEAEKKKDLAAAYLGKAGITIPNLTIDILKSGQEGNPFKSVTLAFVNKANSKSLSYQQEAADIFSSLANNNCTSPSLNDFEKDACFSLSFVDVSMALTNFDMAFAQIRYPIGQELSAWAANDTSCQFDTDQNGIVDSAQINACALTMQASNAVTAPLLALFTSKYAYCGQIKPVGNYTFGTNDTYFVVNFDLNASAPCTQDVNAYKVFVYDGGQIKLVNTEGFCYASNGSYCEALNETTGCLPCPVLINGKPQKFLSVVSELNDGITLAAYLTNGTSVSQTISDYIKEICSADPASCTCDGRPCTSAADVDNATIVKIGSNETQQALLLGAYLIQ